MSRTIAAAFTAGAAVLALIFLAGFFHGAGKPAGAALVSEVRRSGEDQREWAPVELTANARPLESAPKPQSAGAFLHLTSSPAYKRAGSLSLKVADCTKAEDQLESKLESIRGEILEMVMEGTEGWRTCTISLVIPADTFRAFIQDLRQMGKVQSERITASKLRPGGGPASREEAPDPRELSLVSIWMADEKVAQDVLEGRGLLAASLDRSASHFLKGLAVLVEGVGYALPVAIGFVAIALPVFTLVRLRRRLAQQS